MRLRPPTPADADAVLELLAARDEADLGEADYTLEDLESDWRRPGFELARDARVAEEGGRVVAVAQHWGGPDVLVAVHPEAEGRGAGTALREWVEERGWGRQYVGERNRAGRALLARAGYRAVRFHWRMELDLAAPPPAPRWPPGFAHRAVEPEADAAAVHAVSEAAFAVRPDHTPETLDAFRAEHLAHPHLDPALSLVAEEDGRLVGFGLGRRWEGERGYVDLLAVHPDHAHRGLGRALLRATLTAFRDAGLREGLLSVAGDNPRALGLYESAGMTPRWRADTYERAAG